jgi:lipid-A-disaccharide synthase
MKDNIMTAVPPSIMFIAGEPSGDLHASAVIKNLKARRPDLRIWGIGGPAMASAGLERAMPFEPFNCMGYAEVIRHLPFFLGAKKKLIAMMASPPRPSVLVCVDYSGFNMPMMKAARKLGIPVVWYIAPMVWAWKRKRAKVLGEHASHIAVIFPFEEQYFSPYKAPVTFVGNPLTESLPQIDASSPRKFTPAEDFRLAIVPGSRAQEIKNMLGAMVGAAAMLRDKYPKIKITVSRFKGLDESMFEPAVRQGFDLFTDPLPELLQNSDLALITSGTATLETALLGVPMVIAYRTSPLSYTIYKSFVKISHIGLPNIIADRSIVPECIQDDVTPNNLYCKMDKFLSTPSYWEDAVQSLSALRSRLGEKKPSIELADIVYSYVG